MTTQQPKAGWYEPAGRNQHSTAVVGESLFLWAGDQERLPNVHDNSEKRAFLSRVDVFHLQRGSWEQQTTSGTPPLGAVGYACVAVDSDLHYFGGYCGHVDCYHNSVHRLSTSSLHWRLLAPTTTEGRGPMRRSHCGMVAFKDGEEDFLFVVGGIGPTPSSHQPGAQYERGVVGTETNEQHMFSLSTSGWSSPTVTGQPPPPCCAFTLTSVGDKRAAMFGGSRGSEYFNDLLIIELQRNSVHWSKISKPVHHSVQWPEGRRVHTATCVSGPVLVMVGGRKSRNTLIECWICDTTTMLWKKLSLPESVSKRYQHSVSTFQVVPQCVWLVVFGGLTGGFNFFTTRIACPAIVELVQEGDGQWSVGMVMEGVALADSREYQDRLAEARRKGLPAAAAAVGDGTMIEQQLHRQVHQTRGRSRELEQEQQQLQQQLLQQAQQQVQQLQEQLAAMRTEREQELQTSKERAQQQVQELQEQFAEEQRHWVVRREEVVMTSEVVGRGGLGEVRVAEFRGLRVAAKCLHQVILSDYNRRLFTREMSIAAKIRHPNLLLFIGATREGEPVLLSELMVTSLRKELEKGELAKRDIISISRDVACGLNYLHQWKPHPIIHRDISSGNVLLEPLPNGWRAKVSDYGSANFMDLISSTVAPGCPAYAAPEANFPRQHSPKMDVFSFGVLLVETCLHEFPEARMDRQEGQILRIKWPSMVSLIRRCISERPADRPSMSDIMEQLGRL